jgi:hypothetical protein
MTAIPARCALLMVSSCVATDCKAAAGMRERWIRAESYAGSWSARAATVVTGARQSYRCAAALDRNRPADAGERVVDVRPGCGDLLRRRRVVAQVALGQPHRSDVDRQRRVDDRRPEHELGGTPLRCR